MLNYPNLRIMLPIGKGQHATVYRGVHTVEDPKYVAIKVYAHNHIKYAKAEVDVLKLLDHPNILKLIDSPVEHVIVTNIYPATLKKYVNSNIITKLICDVAKGLNYLHTKSPVIIHRDIKADNIFASDTGAVIGDFGFAVICEPGESVYMIDRKSGTPSFMAPEIFDPISIYSPASDMWAFGVMLWEILTKKEAYEEIKSIKGYIKHIQNGHRLNMDMSIVPDDKKLLFGLVEMCFKDMGNRPNAKKFIDLLQF